MKPTKKEIVEQLKRYGLKADVLKPRGEINSMKQSGNNMKKVGIEKL